MVRRRLAVAVAGGVFLVGVGYAAQEPALEAYLSFQVGRAPSEATLAKVAKCEPLEWVDAARVTAQDLDVPCDAAWLVEGLGALPGEREQRWIGLAAEDPLLSSRARARLGLVLWAQGRPVPPMLPFLLTEPGNEAEAALAVSRMRDGEPASWADPLLLGMTLDRPEPGLLTVPQLWMGVTEARARPPADGVERVALGLAALAALGLPPTAFEDLQRRRRAGLPPPVLSEGFARVLVNRGGVCLALAHDECLQLLGDLLVQLELDQEGSPEMDAPPDDLLPMPLWRTLYPADPDVVRARIAALTEVAEWVVSSPDDQAVRLLHSVAHAPSSLDPAEIGTGRVGDPATALAHRMAPPFTAALAALTVGELSGVPVGVHGLPDGVVLASGDVAVGVGPCGSALPVPARESWGPQWPAGAVLAAAALEAAGLSSEPERSRLMALALRNDPLQTPVVVPPASESAARGLGREVGRAIASWPGAELTGAADARSAWKATWAASPTWGCPGAMPPAAGTR